MHPRVNSILVTFEDGVKTLINPHEDEVKILKWFDRMEIKYWTKELTPEQAFEWLKENER